MNKEVMNKVAKAIAGVHPENFKDTTGKIYLVRCTVCFKENYAGQVAAGKCFWCGFDANAKESH